jgi:hypothetical protein
MRVVAIAVVTGAIIIMGLTLRSPPFATAGARAGTQIEPYALHSQVSAKSLPEETSRIRFEISTQIKASIGDGKTQAVSFLCRTRIRQYRHFIDGLNE